ncbi:MAG: DUF1858 domain-containing protein [Parcubacteria group bacterium]|nr:DUF1858 domain-containing protein [Parcubacteria group bacterium]
MSKITKITTKTKKITKDTTLGEVLELPGAEQILAKYKVPCLTCPMAQMEMGVLTIGNICKMYGVDLEGILKELNKTESK